MHVRRAVRAVALAALAASAAGCAHRAAATTQSIPQTLTEANKKQAYAVGRRLAAQDRADEAAHRAQMDRLIAVSVLSVRDEDRQTDLLVSLRNKTSKTIRAFDAGLEVRSAPNGRRIGLAEIHLNRTVRGRGSDSVWIPLRYVRFGEDAGTMRLARGKAKRTLLEVTEITYADGSDAGYDD